MSSAGDRSSAGGAAGAAGEDVRAEIATRIAVYILAQQPLWIPAPVAGVPVSIRPESGAEVDDILVRTSADGRLWIQSKRRLGFGTTQNSELVAAVDQAVRQFLEVRDLDPDRDRIVIAYTTAVVKIEMLTEVVQRFHHAHPKREDVVVPSSNAGQLAGLLDEDFVGSFRA
jgi:hypothetical protein